MVRCAARVEGQAQAYEHGRRGGGRLGEADVEVARHYRHVEPLQPREDGRVEESAVAKRAVAEYIGHRELLYIEDVTVRRRGDTEAQLVGASAAAEHDRDVALRRHLHDTEAQRALERRRHLDRHEVGEVVARAADRDGAAHVVLGGRAALGRPAALAAAGVFVPVAAVEHLGARRRAVLLHLHQLELVGLPHAALDKVVLARERHRDLRWVCQAVHVELGPVLRQREGDRRARLRAARVGVAVARFDAHREDWRRRRPRDGGNGLGRVGADGRGVSRDHRVDRRPLRQPAPRRIGHRRRRARKWHVAQAGAALGSDGNRRRRQDDGRRIDLGGGCRARRNGVDGVAHHRELRVARRRRRSRRIRRSLAGLAGRRRHDGRRRQQGKHVGERIGRGNHLIDAHLAAARQQAVDVVESADRCDQVRDARWRRGWLRRGGRR